MTTGIVQDRNLEKQLEKQMGCMAGFLQIFDRHQILTGKRLYSTKRLPPSPAVDSPSESESSRELENPQQSPLSELRSPAPEPTTPAEIQTKMTLPLPVFEFKEGTRSPWKFSKEAPRLSLDSRAIVDAKGSLKPREIRTSSEEQQVNDDNDKQRRSPSVIARLMGLEPLSNSDPEPVKKSELRRSASESRVSRDLFQYRFIDGINFQLKQQQQQSSVVTDNVGTKEEKMVTRRVVDPKEHCVRSVRGEPAKALHRGGGIGQKKCFFDSADFFPEPKQTVSIYGQIEKRLKMRGIDEPSKDLDTLKQILEVLQLKGLLHCKRPGDQINHRNFVYDRSFDESPIVLMKPARSPINRPGRIGNERSRPGPRRNPNLSSDTLSPRRDRPEIERSQTRGRSAVSPTRSESNNVKSPNRRRALNVETQRRGGAAAAAASPVQSPKVSPRRTGSDQTTNRSPGIKKPTVEIYQKEEKVFVPPEDESSTVSESSISTSSQTDTERSKVEDYKEGRSILERCDKLLHSIAEMTAATTTELQPSPVSVLDSSFYKEESSPSPVMKRSIEFKDQLVELEDDMWSPAISHVQSKYDENSDDCDFIYITDILRAYNYLPEDSDVFLLLEKQQYLKGKDTSKVSRLERRLIFDTITEILNRKRQLPPWKAISWTNSNVGQVSSQEIWSEFKKIRERDTSEDLFEAICGVLRKDLAGDAISGWVDCPIEMSEAVLDIERLIFKDLIGETIRDLAAFAGKLNKVPVPCRKLMF